jgi:hypothetical protein
MDRSDFSDLWIAHLRPLQNPYLFPREVGSPEKIFVKNVDEYISWLRRNSGKRDCYVSVYSEEQKKRKMLDTIYTETDDIAFGFKLWDRFDQTNIEPRALFSGRRGLHFFVDFEPIVLKNPKEAIRAWVNTLPISRKDKKEDRFDMSVVGDTERISRVPYTKNIKSKMMCFNLPPDRDEAAEIVKEYLLGTVVNPPMIYPEVDLNNKDVARFLFDTDSKPPKKIGEGVGTIDEKRRRELRQRLGQGEVPFCIKNFLDELQTTGELDHYQRLQLATYMYRVGHTPESIIDLFRKFAKDFSETYTSNQVNYLIKRDLKMRSCASAIAVIGNCCYSTERECAEKCPWYPSLNWWTG